MLFSHLATVFETIEQTSSRLTMTELLATLFAEVALDEISSVCYLLQGRVAPLYEPIEFGMADKYMIRAITVAYNTDADVVMQIFRREGDLGNAAQVISRQQTADSYQHKRLTIREVFTKLQAITRIGGEGSQEKKIGMVAELLQAVDPLSARYIIRIPLGKLRLGFSDMTILDGLSWMIAGNKSHRERLESCFNIRPDIGLLAEQVKREGMAGLENVHAVVGAPILSALCQRLPTADEMIEKMGTVAVEPKYDGVRVQIHFKRSAVSDQLLVNSEQLSVYSRNLENTTAMFPELEHMGEEINGDSVILDAEAIGIDRETGAILPFQETTTRRRKHGVAEMAKRIPLKFFIFDILYKDKRELLSTPLSERRTLLEETVNSGGLFELSPYIVTNTPETIRDYHAEQLAKRLEGVVIKKWDGVYESGRRSYNWVKFKEEEGKTGKLTDTIDAVVMGYYYGEGKRNSFGIGAFLVGVTQGETVVTVSKIGTGVSDEQWKELLVRFEKVQVKTSPKQYIGIHKIYTPDVWLEPTIVVEIAGDDLTKSPSHGAGYAVRFPRLIRVREDKSVATATTVAELQSMYESQTALQ